MWWTVVFSLKGELTQDCPLHEGRELEYYCEDHKIPICSRCVIVGDHKGHVITSMEEKVYNGHRKRQDRDVYKYQMGWLILIV